MWCSAQRVHFRVSIHSVLPVLRCFESGGWPSFYHCRSHGKTFLTSHRWVLCANHTEPVKGFLGRFLRRKLMETEISGRVRNVELVKIIDWIPKVWHHLNRFLEAHSSSDVTIGGWEAGREPVGGLASGGS